ncbi:piggyBac transposable element-derived protein 4-like [Sardina pilchardus]|uniref:piggyBac transposable element-derived protein 4-like n=1 Tax=Sardina pilchardus TaxID=27697 RepID=UPI002E1377FE
MSDGSNAPESCLLTAIKTEEEDEKEHGGHPQAEVAEMCCQHINTINDYNSGEDSEIGGLSSGEEYELDRELDEDFRDSDSDDDNNAETQHSPGPAADSEEDDPEPEPEREAPEGMPERPCAGRGRGRGRGRASHRVNQPVVQTYSYDDSDMPNQLPSFRPVRQPGVHLDAQVTRSAMTKAIDFFKLFFTDALLLQICTYTNAYAWEQILRKPYYGGKDGTWKETSPDELLRLMALVMFCGLVPVRSFYRYWSTKTLYHGMWARSIMSRDRFKALMAMLHVVDPGAEDERDKLRKVTGLLETFKVTCKALYQPFQHVAVDERMVKSKHRSGIQQYIKNKPTKWGIKLWVLADSLNGYTYDFDVYTGRKLNDAPSENGLGYDVVMRLTRSLAHQGYHVYFDNFYTSPKLVNDLFQLQMPSCGTTAENRRGFPESVKKGKEWVKGKDRGAMRWVRDNCCLALQWKDNRPVTLLSSIHSANEFLHVQRREKFEHKWRCTRVKQPKAIHDYNFYMNGVDRSDQLIGQSTALRKCMRWWKTLFFHMMDIAVVNSFILFQIHRAAYPDAAALKRPQKYSVTEFREELVRQLAGLEEYGDPPVYEPVQNPGEFVTDHIPCVSDTKRNCRVCYDTSKQALKVVTKCDAPQCQVYLHITHDKNCFEAWHTKNYEHRKN